MTINDLYRQLFGRGGTNKGTDIDMAEHGRVGGLSTGQPFKFTYPIDSTTGNSIVTGLATSAKQLPDNHQVTANLSATDNAVLDDIAANQTDGTQKSQPIDTSGNNIGGKVWDENTSTYKGLLFNADAPQVCSQDYLLALAEGDITGHTPFTKYGRVSGVNNTIVDVWAGEGGTASVYVFPPSAIQFTVASTSTSDDLGSTGIEKIMIVGLDANYASQIEEVTMDGTTDVITTKSFLRVNFCYATQAGSNGVAAGTITVKNAAKTITYTSIGVGLTSCRTLVYTVPAGKTLYLTSINCASGAGGNSIKLNAVVFTPKVRAFGSTIFLPQGELLTLNGDIIRPLEMPAIISAKSDVKMSVQGDYASGGTLCIGAVRGWLE